MIKIAIKIDDIDYISVANVLVPELKDRLSYFGMSISLIEHIPQEAMLNALRVLLESMTQEQKDIALLDIINDFNAKLIEVLELLLSENNVELSIKSLSACKTDLLNIEITIDDINYKSAVTTVTPVIKEKLFTAQADTLLITQIGQRAILKAINGLLMFATQNQKDSAAVDIINRFDDKIIQLLQQSVSEKDINLTICGICADKIV